ncbi:MAG: hypothetical protein HC880_19855 [Bacteroidia bacterium]|nr:hypothetical protein [Bacteroidia bacterium]
MLLEPGHTPLAMYLLSFGTSYELYVNGQYITANGKVATHREDIEPYALPQVCSFDNGGDTLDIIVQVANFSHKYGGFWHSIRLGASTQIQMSRDRQVAVDVLLAGSFFIMSIYHFGIFSAAP